MGDIQKCRKCKTEAHISAYKLINGKRYAKTCDACLLKQKIYRSKDYVKAKKSEYNTMYNKKIADNWDEYYARNKERYSKNSRSYYQRVIKPRKLEQKASDAIIMRATAPSADISLRGV